MSEVTRRQWIDSEQPLMPWQGNPSASRPSAPFSDENAQKREFRKP